MKYIKDVPKLVEVARTLASHLDDAKSFYFAQLNLQIDQDNDVLVNLPNLFAIANREQRGFSTENLLGAYNSFGDGLEEILNDIEELDAEKAHLSFLRWLCSGKIPRTNQKTANLFLKWVIMFNDAFDFSAIRDWSWKPYLHVPLDIWVTRLLGKEYLDIGTEDYNHDFSPTNIPNFTSQFNKYSQLQTELRELTSKVNQPPIVFDELWLIGHLYCTYKNILCDRCWVSQYCVNPINPLRSKSCLNPLKY